MRACGWSSSATVQCTHILLSCIYLILFVNIRIYIFIFSQATEFDRPRGERISSLRRNSAIDIQIVFFHSVQSCEASLTPVLACQRFSSRYVVWFGPAIQNPRIYFISSDCANCRYCCNPYKSNVAGHPECWLNLKHEHTHFGILDGVNSPSATRLHSNKIKHAISIYRYENLSNAIYMCILCRVRALTHSTRATCANNTLKSIHTFIYSARNE